MGFIAQDIEKIFPQWVVENPDGYKALNLKGIEALIVESIKEINSTFTKNSSENNSDLNQIDEYLKKIEDQIRILEEQKKAIKEQEKLIKQLQVKLK